MGKKADISEKDRSLIVTLKEDGKSNKDIAKMVKVSDRTVRRVLQKYRETGSVTPKKEVWSSKLNY